MAVQAIAKNIRIAPSKLRPVLNVVRGKAVEEAIQILNFLPSPNAKEVMKVVQSAAANADANHMMARPDLIITAIYADLGISMKRYRAHARGRAGRIVKRSSHITVVVDEKES